MSEKCSTLTEMYIMGGGGGDGLAAEALGNSALIEI